MSVPKSQRGEPRAKFLQDVYRARKTTLEVLRKFPKGYKFNLPAHIAELADKAYWYATEGNAVYMYKGMAYEDYRLRREKLLRAYTTMRALVSETSFCCDLAVEGNNIFESRQACVNTFSRWGQMCAAAATSLKTILESDRKRYKEYCEAKDASTFIKQLESVIEDTLQANKQQVMDAVKQVLL